MNWLFPWLFLNSANGGGLLCGLQLNYTKHHILAFVNHRQPVAVG